jgi:Prokaryotic Cytochrome C oxidase subunit IV
MTMSLQKRLIAAWAVLAGVTLLAWWIGARHGSGPLHPDAAVAISAIVITLVKVRVIVREFMHVRTAPARLKHVTDGWLAAFGAAMLLAYFT